MPPDSLTAAKAPESGDRNFLKIAMVIVVVACLLAGLLINLLAPQQYRRLIGFGLAAVAAALTLLDIQRGNTLRAHRMLTYGVWCGVTVSAAINGGMGSPAILAYPVLIMVAGWLMGTRTVLVLTGMSLAAELLFVAGAAGHWLPEQLPAPPSWAFLTHTLILSVSASLALFIRRSFAARFAEIARRDEEILAQHGLYRAVLDAQSSADIGMFIIEAGRIVYSNPAFCRLLGFNDEELRALPSFAELVHPDDRERVIDNHRRRLAGEQFGNRYDIGVVRKDGVRREVEITVGSLSEKEAARLLVIAVDITEQRQAYQAVLRSEARFAQAFQVSPVATSISRFDDGRYLEVNDAFLRLFGWPRDAVIGRSSVDLGIWPSPDLRSAWVDRLRGGSCIQGYETEMFTRDQTRLVALVSADVIDFADQRCILSFVHDITARRHAENMMREIVEGTARATGDEFFRALVRHLARALEAPIALIGEVKPDDATQLHTLAFWAGEGYLPTLDYALANTPCGEVFGREPTLISTGLPMLFPLAACAMQAAAADSYYGYPLTSAAGEPLGVLAIMDTRPLQESDERASLMSIFAARAAAELERQRAEAEIRSFNLELEERVRERTAELVEANHELESFAYSMSHDLRAPLRGIDGFSRLLQEEYGERLDTQGREYLVRVRRAAQRLGTLIDDLLELSRVTRQEMQRVKVDLSALATAIVDNLRKADPERVVVVSVAPHCTVKGDPQLLRVLLENLIGNAWKYSRHTTDARIEFGTETTPQEVRYFVRDNGVGFDMTYADKLFIPFQRLHNPAEFEGSGIGLASAARVVRRHGGRIWAESHGGAGAVFHFTLDGHG